MSVELTNAIEFFIATFAELAILFIVISFVVSVINHKLPPEKIKLLLSGNQGYGVAVSLGALTPFCSCSTLPMTIGLIKARAAFGPIMAFLFTSPLLNPFIFGLFWITFGAKVTLTYSGFVVALSVFSGFVLERARFQRFIKADLFSSCGTPSENEDAKSSSGCAATQTVTSCCDRKEPNKWQKLFSETWSQFISFAPYMVIGVAVGSILHGYVPQSMFAKLNGYNMIVVIPLAALIGILLYVRASTMVPIATALIAKGMTMGSVISLTIAGAGASLPEMIMMKRMFHWPLMSAFIFIVLATACVTGFAIELF